MVAALSKPPIATASDTGSGSGPLTSLVSTLGAFPREALAFAPNSLAIASAPS